MQSCELMDTALRDCTEAQCEAIRHTRGPLLVLAGPGSGKTRVITRRIAYLVGSGARPDEILAITFTNKAAGEMRERVETLGAAQGAWLSTFHAFCAKVLRIYGRHLDLDPSFTIYDSADTLAAMKRAMDQLEIDAALFKPAFLARAVSDAKGRMELPEQVEASRIADAATIAKVYRRYARLLREAHAVDFDDLLLMAVRLFRETPKVGDALRRRFSHILVDEYQDTNRAQYLIAKHLAERHRNLCATGDPDQSVYGWRGADINNILDFESDYPDAKIVRLEQNYRSTKRILSAADKLISFNVARKPKGLWTENEEGPEVRVLRCENERDEADRVAGEIARLIRDEGIAPRGIAVFYRVNAQSRVLEASLRGETIPYLIVAGTEYYQRKEVKDLLAYLRLAANPADDVSAQRVANVPQRRLGNTSLARLRTWAENHDANLTEAMAEPQRAGVRGAAIEACTKFLGVLKSLRATPQTPVAPLVEKLIAVLDYETWLRRLDNSEERIANTRELVNAAAEFNLAEPEGTLQDFLEQTALVSDTDRWDAEKGAVTLMTLHSAKGLEFPAVFIVGLEEGLLPLMREEVVRDLEEERRLLFVGVTRAKNRLTMTYAVCRTRYGTQTYAKPSRFLDELPESVRQEAPLLPFFAPASPRRNAGRRRVEPRRVQRGETEEIVYDGEQPHDDIPPVIDALFEAGDQVVHPSYGRGTVVEIRGFGETTLAVVRFPTVGVKKLSLQFARLKKG